MRFVLLLLGFLTMTPGCTAVKRFAINKLGDTLASGGSVYESDEDLELVGDAIPFGLKLIESLLAESPNHRGLLQAACSGFATYSYAYVQFDADEADEVDLDRGNEIRARARRLYLRARRYGLRGLERTYPGITARLESDPTAALRVVRKKEDVPLLYWNAAALGLAISVSRGDAEMLAHLPEVNALVERALLLDESWQEGSLHEFEIVLAGAHPGVGPPEDLPRIKGHFDRALQLSGGKRSSLYVSYAESVSIRTQDAAEFRSLLAKALAINPDDHEEIRLPNLVAQRRAKRLMSRIEQLFLEGEAAATGTGGS